MMTPTATSLNGIRLLLSASLPDELVGTPQAQDLYDLLVVFVSGVLSSDGGLVIGGHPTVTPLVHRIAGSVGVEPGQIQLFQLEQFRGIAPAEAFDKLIFGDIRWCSDLASMRECMAGAANAAVFAGGRTSGNVAGEAGIRDEFERFLAHHPEGPAYLVGSLAGETAKLIAECEPSPAWGPKQLSGHERHLIATSGSVDLAASLVLTDLASVSAAMGTRH